MKAHIIAIACMITLAVPMAITMSACTQSPTRSDSPMPIPLPGPPPGTQAQRFVLLTSDLSSVEGLHQFDLAFDAGTGRICKTWNWTIAGDTALNSIPECYEMLRQLNKELQEEVEELGSNPYRPSSP